jgi:hypothetical protein
MLLCCVGVRHARNTDVELQLLGTKRMAESQAPSREVLRLALSHDREKRGECRRSAAGGETVIETRQGRGLGRADATNTTENGQSRSNHDSRGAHLPFGKRTHQADMTAYCAVMMKALMKRMTDREDGRNQEQHHQQGGESRSWQASIAEECSSQLQDDGCN